MGQGTPIIPTGLESIDRLLAGGIPARQSLIITGSPGTGKTILCSQIAFAHAKAGQSVVLATVASQSNEKLLDELRNLRFFDEERVGNELYVLSAFPWVKRGPKDAREVLLKVMRERNARLLCIDGTRSLRDIWRDEANFREFLYELNVGIAQLDAVCVLTTEYDFSKLVELPEATTVDGIIALSARRSGGRVVRRAQVAKLRGRAHLQSEHVMHISEEGIRVVPRLEETTHPDPAFVSTGERAQFGLAELDHVLGGGLPEKSTTLLAGGTGIGKSLMALHFVVEGARRGEPSLFVTYSEPVARLVSRAKGVGLDIAPLLESGRLRVVYRTSIHTEADDLIDEILRDATAMGAKRVVIDGVGEIEESVWDKERIKPLLSALIIRLRDMGTTSIFIKEVPKIAGFELDFSDAPISVTAENVIFARHMELRGRIHRILSVLKMRESAHDPYVREFEISERGLRVLEPMSSVEGLLTGVARPLQGVQNGAQV